MGDKEHLSVVVCGHVDAGKSTTCGHLIFKCGGVSDREMTKLQQMAEEKGKSSFGFAYYLGKLGFNALSEDGEISGGNG